MARRPPSAWQCRAIPGDSTGRMMTDQEQAYVRRRAQLQGWWPWMGCLLLALVLGLWGYLFLSGSLLVNPWALLERLERNDVGVSTLAALAVLGTMGFLSLGVVMLAVLGLLWSAMRNERRLLDIIRKQERERSQPGPGG
jgi:hypothetical protein